MIKDGLLWLLKKIGVSAAWLVGTTALELEPIFIIAAVIGIYLVMFGEKRWGTRLTSFSILIYIVARCML